MYIIIIIIIDGGFSEERLYLTVYGYQCDQRLKNCERRLRERGFPFDFRPLQNRKRGVGGEGRMGNGMTAYLRKYGGIDRFQSRGQQLCKLLGNKESLNM